MAFVEAAVVVYLRALHPGPAPATVLLTVIPDRLALIEVAREAATLVMLLGVAMLAGRDRWERFLYFCLAFGVWDIGYYAWLWVLIHWPPTLLTWDVLFLIPVPWLAPVLAPLIVSGGLVGGATWFLRDHALGVRYRFPWWVWVLAGLGTAMVLLSFTLDYRFVLQRAEPAAFRWWLFGAGAAVAGGAVVARMIGDRPHKPGPAAN